VGFYGSNFVTVMKEQTFSTRIYVQEWFICLILMQCPICGEGVVAKFKSTSREGFKKWIDGQDVMGGHTCLLATYPKSYTLAAPEHTPDNVKRFYVQGLDNMAGNFDAAGTMFRKSLDAALKHIDPTGKGTLEKRIDNLPAATGVTPPMKEWAHEIRDLGNDAAHEEDPFTEAEAKSLQAFTELFLQYVFTLPGMLAARKPTQTPTT
jgi:hypothetical protein